MERLMKGGMVELEESAEGKTPFCDFSLIVRRGHMECGDSAFVYSDENKLLAGVFDGVSGEPGAEQASSDAAEAALSYLKNLDRIGEEEMKEALSRAHLSIKISSTTASLLYLKKDGSFMVAAIGDSPIYGVDAKGGVSLEIPPARTVRDRDSILKYFAFRNYITAALGGPAELLEVSIRKGRLKKGEMLIVASDGLSDNLFVETEDGYVSDSSGVKDLQSLIKGKRTPSSVIKTLMAELAKRLSEGRVEKPGRILQPKEDDIAIAAIRLL
ncbi:MAG: protein phosphatase 2C domain-containing protein [Candidatus Micrarchaeota archaeon]